MLDCELLDRELSPASANMFVSLDKVFSLNCLIDLSIIR